MDALTMVKKLAENGYSLNLIAKQSNMAYMALYRSLNEGRNLKPEEEAAIKRFAIVQPCMGN